MAQGTSTSFGNFLIKLGDGGGPEVFAAPCGLTTKGFNQTANVQETTVPDCSDEDAAAFIERGVDTLSSEISGAGVMTQEAFTTWRAWFLSAASKNCRIYPNGASGGYWQGAFILSAFNLTVNRGQKVEVSVTMQSDGAYTWTNPDS